MKSAFSTAFRAVLLLIAAILITGCQVAVPGCGGCRSYHPCRSPEFHLHCDPCQGGTCRPSAARSNNEANMSINVVPTGLMGRSLLGVSKLVAASEAFRKECGNKTATATLNDHCHFPDMPLSLIHI